jgi:hypothetical protein
MVANQRCRSLPKYYSLPLYAALVRSEDLCCPEVAGPVRRFVLARL